MTAGPAKATATVSNRLRCGGATWVSPLRSTRSAASDVAGLMGAIMPATEGPWPNVVGPTGFEPVTRRLRVCRSNRAELRAHVSISRGPIDPEGGRGDLNPQPPGPQPGALTELSYGHHASNGILTARVCPLSRSAPG